MQLIVALSEKLDTYIGPCIGRYDDGFNLNCVGDTFQAEDTPTVLFEAGHYPGDYQREVTRKYIWMALVHGLELLANDRLSGISIEKYKAIPNNEKLFFDILIKNAFQVSSSYSPGERIGILFKEVLEDHHVKFVPEISSIGELGDHYGHTEYDCEKEADLKKIRADDSLNSLIF